MHLIDDKTANGKIIRVEGATPGGEDKPFMIEEVQLTNRAVRTIKQLEKPAGLKPLMTPSDETKPEA